MMRKIRNFVLPFTATLLMNVILTVTVAPLQVTAAPVASIGIDSNTGRWEQISLIQDMLKDPEVASAIADLGHNAEFIGMNLNDLSDQQVSILARQASDWQDGGAAGGIAVAVLVGIGFIWVLVRYTTLWDWWD